MYYVQTCQKTEVPTHQVLSNHNAGTWQKASPLFPRIVSLQREICINQLNKDYIRDK